MVSHKPDIVKTIRAEGIELTRAGDCYKGLCPWHDDANPSLVVWPKIQVYKCFGECNATGDVISFIQRHKNMSFKQACNYLKVTPGKTRKQKTAAHFINAFESLAGVKYQLNGKVTGEDLAEFSLVMLPLMFDYILSEAYETLNRGGKQGTKKPTGAPKDGKKYAKVSFD